MSWKSLNTNNGGSLKHVASSAMLISTKTECKKRLLEILLSNNLNLLSVICQSPLANETGSTLPKSILKLLMTYQSEDIEPFIVRLLSYKARMYHIKNRDACDILRDNSFLSIFLNSYAHEIGYRYLTSTLNNTIKEILHYAKDLELDPHRIKRKIIENQSMNQNQLRSAPVQETISVSIQNEPLTAIKTSPDDDMDEEEIEMETRRVINNNIAKIENICLTLLNTIINNKEKMPNSLHHLCYSIANVIEESYTLEVENTDVSMADLYYVSRQNSYLSMFNISNYEECKTPTGELSTNHLCTTPLSATPKSACNYIDDKDIHDNILEKYNLDTQNIYNQSIYSASAMERDKTPLQSNGNINYPLSASSTRPYSHKKHESYTSGMSYNNVSFDFLQLKNYSSNVSYSSNVNGESEEEITGDSSKYLSVRPQIYGKEYRISNNSINNSMELKPEDNYSGRIIEKRSLKDRDNNIYLKPQRLYNMMNNDLIGKNLKIQNRENKKILSSSENDLQCSQDDSTNNGEEDYESGYKSCPNRSPCMPKEDDTDMNEYYLELDFCKEESILDHFNDRNSYTIEEEEEDIFKEEILKDEEGEILQEERNSLDSNEKDIKEKKNQINYQTKSKNNYEKEDKLEEGYKGERELQELKMEIMSDNDNEIDNESDNNKQDRSYENVNIMGAVEVISPTDFYDEFDGSINESNSYIEKELEGLDNKDIYTFNDESINNQVTRFNNKSFFKQFLKKDSFQIKDIKTAKIISVKNYVKEASDDRNRGEALDLNKISELLLHKKDKYILIDGSRESSLNSVMNSNRNSIIMNNFNKIHLNGGSGSLSCNSSIDNCKTDIEINNFHPSSVRLTYKRNYSENMIDIRKNDKEDISIISDDDIHFYVSESQSTNQLSQSSISHRKNELGLKIETDYNKLSQKSMKPRKLSDDIGFDTDKSKSKYKDFKSAAVKENPKKYDIKPLYSSRENYLDNEERYFISLNDLECNNDNRKSKLEKQGSGYFLTNAVEYSNSEKVVGTFLFLRFFVPAVTSPENFGLANNKITVNERKSLIICGKVLTALCNNVNFGGKEKYMEYLNPFLQVHREETKEFLQWAMQYNENENGVISPVSAIVRNNIDPNTLILSPKTKKEYDYDTISNRRDKNESEYNSENSSYSSLNILEPNMPSGKSVYDEKNKHINDLIFSSKKKSNHHKNIASEDGYNFSSMPILNSDSTSSSFDHLSSKEKISKSKDYIIGSKGSIFHKQNLKVGSMRVKHIPTDLDSSKSSIRGINPNEIKKDFEAEVRDIMNFLSKNMHLLEKEIESKTSVMPEEECEGVYSGFLELKQLVYLSEDNSSMKHWFKKIFRTKYSNSVDSLLLQKSSSKSRRSSNNNLLVKSNVNLS